MQLVGVSCDPMHALRAWAEAEKYEFPLLSDFWPHGEVARSYGVFSEKTGFAIRGTFLVDTSGVLRWSVVNGPGEARDSPRTVRRSPRSGSGSGPVAQLVEHRVYTAGVVGSNPAGPTQIGPSISCV